MQIPAGLHAALLLAVAWTARGTPMSEDDVLSTEVCEGHAAQTSLLQNLAASLQQAPGNSFLQARLAMENAQQAELDRRLGRFKESMALSASLRALTYAQARLELLTWVDIGLLVLGFGIVVGFLAVFLSNKKKPSDDYH